MEIARSAPLGGAGADPSGYASGRGYAWTVFALTFGLMLSDYMSRQVIGAVFPLLKVEWGVSDSQLGSLVSVVSLVVGLMTIPMSLIADRWGRVKSITLMAFVWCFATIACGLADGYAQMLLARALVGFGEAAYSAAGAALLAHTFPIGKRSAVLGAFQSAGLFGSVLGVVIGGAVAAQLGWRAAFFAVGVPGLVLAAIYPFLVRDYASVKLHAADDPNDPVNATLRFGQLVQQVFATRSGNLSFLAFGLQMAMPSILIAWVPTYFNRFYGFDAKKAALMAAVAVLAAGIGMLLGGGVADRLSKNKPRNRALVPCGYAVVSGLVLMLAFALPPSPLAMALVFGGALFAAAHGGSALALIMDVTHPAVRATVTATAVVGATLLGMAPGPYLVGVLSDFADMKTALTVAPLVSVVAAALFALAARYYVGDMAKAQAHANALVSAVH